MSGAAGANEEWARRIADIVRADTERNERRFVACAQRPGWYAETPRDGGAHYGRRDSRGEVHADCGRVFTPMRSVISGIVMVWQRPVESDHACATCLTAWRSTSAPEPGGDG